jgi:hypothetical protein
LLQSPFFPVQSPFSLLLFLIFLALQLIRPTFPSTSPSISSPLRHPGRDLALAGIEQKLQGPGGSWTSCERGRLLAVAAWLLVNSIRTERIQFAMLQLQNLGNVWQLAKSRDFGSKA